MNGDELQRVLDEFEDLRDLSADPDLEAVKAAILLEDLLGIQLSDNDIGPALLDRRVMEAFVVSSQKPS